MHNIIQLKKIYTNVVYELAPNSFLIVIYCIEKMTEFLIACENGDFEKVLEKLFIDTTDELDRNELLRQKGRKGWNCLHWAVHYGDDARTRFLLKIMEEKDVTAKDADGQTAFKIACCPLAGIDEPNDFDSPEPTAEIIKMLFQENNNFINCCDNQNVSPLQCAIKYKHIDVVKLLIDLGALVNHKSGDGVFKSVLHTAATYAREDVIRFLLNRKDCDWSERDCSKHSPCCYYFYNLFDSTSTSNDQIELAHELMLTTYKSPKETLEIYYLLFRCYERHTHHKIEGYQHLSRKVINVLLPHSPMKHFIERILNAKLPGHYSLVVLTLFEMIKTTIDDRQRELYFTSRFLRYDVICDLLQYDLLTELFSLFKSDEPLFNEFIVEVKRMGWTLHHDRVFYNFCQSLTTEDSKPKIFDFTKSLVLHDFDLVPLLDRSHSSDKCIKNYLLDILVPLSTLIHPPFDLLQLFDWERTTNNCFNFNESDNCINDYERLVAANYSTNNYKRLRTEQKSNRVEVVSLKNLSRISIRKNVFENNTQSKALSGLYSLDIPLLLRNFLCYNHSDLKFSTT